MAAPLLALDLDGTLITCAPKQCAVLRAALRAAGVAAEVEAVWSRKREGHDTRTALEAEGVPSEGAQSVTALFVRNVEDFAWLALDRPFPDVVPGLRALRAAGLRLACVTARQRPLWARVELGNLGLLPLLDELIVVSPRAAEREKERALRDLGAFAMVGDTEADAHAAAAAGLPFAAVCTGQRTERFLRGSACSTVLPAFEAAVRWAIEVAPIAPVGGS